MSASRQVVDLRVTFGANMHFVHDAAREAYEAECLQARARQAVRHAVAPRQTLALPSGASLAAGRAVTLADLQGDEHNPAWRLLDRAIRTGVVLEREDIDAPDDVA